MKFTIAFTALVAGASAFVATPVKRSGATLTDRDVDTVTSVLAEVKDGFNSLQQAANDFAGDATQLKQTAASVIDKVESGTTAIKNGTPLSLGEARSLVGPSNELAKQADSLATELENRLADVQSAKECGTVRSFLDTGLADAKELIAAIRSKVPAVAQGIINQQGNKILKPLQRAQAAFTADKCQ